MKRKAEYYRNYYQKHKEKIKADHRKYYRGTHQKYQATSRRRHKLRHISRNLKRRCGVSIPVYQLFGILKRQKMICSLTGKKLTNDNISIDHIIPTAKGGLTEIVNLRFVVNDVNKAKGILSDTELFDLCKDILKTAGLDNIGI